jgi:hypothetical protein
MSASIATNGARALDPELTIVVVSYSTREMTLECLRSIQDQTRDTSYEIIVVDNNSPDNSAEAIAGEFPHVRLIASRENLGFARGNNVAAREARGRKLLLLNPDTLVLDRAIDRLVAFARSTPSSGIWGGRTVFKDGSLNRYSCMRRMTPWSLACAALGLSHLAPDSPIFSSEYYGGWKRDTVRHVDIVSGCFLMIDRALWEQLGGFDPAFFMYAEEADLCLRAHKLGARPIITPDATIVHYEGASAAAPARRIMAVKGKVSLVYRHWPPWSRPLGRMLFKLLPLTRWWVYGLAGRLIGRPDLVGKAGEWRMLWQRRGEWIDGYDLGSGR